MNIITGLVVGVSMGWVASILMKSDSREALIRNVAVGTAGAFVGSWLLSSTLDPTGQGGFNFGLMIASFLGAIALLFLVSHFSRT